MSRARRRTWWVLLALVIATNTVLELSSAVGRWWGRSSEAGGILPAVLQRLVDRRPDTSEGDVHLVLWFVAAALVVLAVRTWGRRLTVLVALWLYSGVIELIQPMTGRSGEWSDFGANALGIAAAAAAMALAEQITEARNRRRIAVAAAGQPASGVGSITIGDSRPPSHHRRSVDHA